MAFNNILLFLGGLGGQEILLILLAIVFLFGAKKIPELARGLGKGIREFKDATNEVKDNLEEGIEGDNNSKKSKSDNNKKVNE